MDNRVFNVNGKTDDQLLAALELVFAQAGDQTCKGWKVTDGGLVLCWYVKSGVIALPTAATAKEIFPMVRSWLKSDEAKTIKCEGWDADSDHDGHNRIGWRVYCGDWGHTCGETVSICAVKPAFMWYGK